MIIHRRVSKDLGKGQADPRADRSTSSVTGRRKGSIDAKARYEKYLALARASAHAGNAVETENYHQHAEHYFRMMKAGAD